MSRSPLVFLVSGCKNKLRQLIEIRLRAAAMQGAFAEHQVMLRRVSLSRPLVILLIRTPVDLAKCDALIIPGGGAFRLLYGMS
jgi:hypothetical protein